MKVLITGGGTGGHLIPAIAVGEALRAMRPDTDLLFVGTSAGMDDRILARSGFRYTLLDVRGVTGKSAIARIGAIFSLVGAFFQALGVVRGFAPDLVVGVGGYASLAASTVAIVRRIPLVLLEQNTRPGLTNRLLWRFAKRICVPFADSAAFFDSPKVAVTGNPLRFRVEFRPVHNSVNNLLQILVLGGSSGAHRLNLGVLNAFKKLEKTVIKLAVVHQTGPLDESMVKSGYAELGVEAKVTPFIEDMADAYQRAELIVSRSGGMTVYEIAAAGRAAIFVPYPFHADLQQLHNARVVERIGGAVIVQDDDYLGDNLARVLRELVSDRSRLASMGLKAHAAARPDSSAEIARTCFEVAGLATEA